MLCGRTGKRRPFNTGDNMNRIECMFIFSYYSLENHRKLIMLFFFIYYNKDNIVLAIVIVFFFLLVQ